MLVIAVTLGAAQMLAPDEALAGKLRSLIWNDLQSNALIGNGNELATRWANAGSDKVDAPALHIERLACDGGSVRLRCGFGLKRDGGPAAYLGEVISDRLDCKVTFLRADTQAEWFIPRLRPRSRGGHSRITIKCKSVAAPTA